MKMIAEQTAGLTPANLCCLVRDAQYEPIRRLIVKHPEIMGNPELMK